MCKRIFSWTLSFILIVSILTTSGYIPIRASSNNLVNTKENSTRLIGQKIVNYTNKNTDLITSNSTEVEQQISTNSKVPNNNSESASANVISIDDIISRVKLFSEATDEEQNIICLTFNLTRDILVNLEDRGYNLKDSINIIQCSKDSNFTIDEVISLLNKYGDIDKVSAELILYSMAVKRNTLSDTEIEMFKSFIMQGYKTCNIESAFIVSKALELNLADVIRKPDSAKLQDLLASLGNTYNEEEIKIITNLEGKYFFDTIVLINYQSQIMAKWEDIEKKITDFSLVYTKPGTKTIDEILAQIYLFSKASQDEQEVICSSLGIERDTFTLMESKGYTLQLSIDIVRFSIENKLSIEETTNLLGFYNDLDTLKDKIILLIKVMDKNNLCDDERLDFRNLFLQGYAIENIESAYRVSKPLGLNLSDVIRKSDSIKLEDIVDNLSTILSNDDIKIITDINNNYFVDISVLLTYQAQSKLQWNEISNKIVQKAVDNNSVSDALINQILSKNIKFSEASDDEQDKICLKYDVEKSILVELEAKGYSLISSLNVISYDKQTKLGIDKIIELLNYYQDFWKLSQTIAYLKDIIVKYNLLQKDIHIFSDYLKLGYNVQDIESAYIAANALEVDINIIIRKDTAAKVEEIVEEYKDVYNEMDMPIFTQIIESNYIDPDFLVDYQLKNNMTINRIYKIIKNYKIRILKMDVNTSGEASIAAETTTEPEALYEKYLVAPFEIVKSGTESINPSDGSLKYESVDLNLPGVKGLNLEIVSRYDSSNAALYEMDVDNDIDYRSYISWNTYREYDSMPNYLEDISDSGVIIMPLKDPNDEYAVQYSYDTREEAQAAIDNYYKTNNIINGENRYRFKDEYGNDMGYSIVTKYSNNIVEVYTDGTINKTTSKKYRTTDLGPGWTLGLPYIEITDDGIEYLHLGDGSEYQIGYGFLGLSQYLKNYELDDLKISKDKSYSYNGSTSSYSLTYLDGKVQYFDRDGNIMATIDRYGNKITFIYSTVNNNRTIQITDTLGRKVIITNNLLNNNETVKKVVINTYANDNITLYKTITYKFGLNSNVYIMIEKTIEDMTTTSPNKIRLVTGYAYDYGYGDFKFSSNSHNGPPAKNTFANLKSIIYPTTAVSMYTYEIYKTGLGKNGGYMYKYRIKTKGNANSLTEYNSGSIYNKEIYAYEKDKDYSGYPNYSSGNLPNDYKYKTYVYTVFKDDVNLNIEKYMVYKVYTFNNKNLKESEQTYKTQINSSSITQTPPADSVILREVCTTYDSCKQPYTTTTTAYNGVVDSYNESYMKGSKANTTEYNSYGDLTSFTDELGHVTAYEYDTNYHILKRVVTPMDSSTSSEVVFEINTSNGNINWKKQCHIENGVSKPIYTYYNDVNSYDSHGNLLKERTVLEDGRNLVINYEYSPEYNYAYLTRKYITVTNYDGTTQVIDERYSYYKNTGLPWKQTIKKKINGIYQDVITEYVYDILGRVVKVINPDSTYKIITYDDKNNCVTFKDEEYSAVPYVISNKYDTSGRIIETNESINGGLTWKKLIGYQYNNLGQVKYSFDAKGNKKVFEYDELGRAVKQINEDNTSKSTDYDDAWIPILYGKDIYDFIVANSKIELDEEGDSGNKVITYYDKIGNVRMTNQVYNGDQYLTTFNYDYAGNLVRSKDGLGNITKYNYDDLGRLIEVIDALNTKKLTDIKSSKYSYGNLGKIISITTPDGKMTRQYYDEIGRMIKITDPAGRSEYIKYDESGSIVEKRDRNGYTTIFNYDNMGRLKDKSVSNKALKLEASPDGTCASYKNFTLTPGKTYVYKYKIRFEKPAQTYNCLYWANYYNINSTTGSYNSDHRINHYNSPSQDMLSKIGEWQEVTGKITAPASSDYAGTTEIGFRGSSLPTDGTFKFYVDDFILYEEVSENILIDTTLENKSGLVDRTAYNNTITPAIVKFDIPNNVSYTYYKNGKVKTIQSSNCTTTYIYYNDWQLQSITQSDGSGSKSVSYTYDQNGNIASVTDPFNKLVAYNYDNRNRMQTVNWDNHSTSYDYYADNTIKTVKYTPNISNPANVVSEEYLYFDNNNLKQITNKKNGTIINSYSYTYDANSNQKTKIDSKGQTVYLYDSLNRVTSTTEADGTVTSYSYDENGNITQKAIMHPSNYILTYLNNDNTEYLGHIDSHTIDYIYDNASNRLLTKTKENVIYKKISSLNISASDNYAPKGKIITFSVSGIMADGTIICDELLSKAKWSCSSGNFKLTSSTGKTITGYYDGTAIESIKITASISNMTAEKYVFTCKIQSVTVTPAICNIAYGSSRIFTVTGKFSDGSNVPTDILKLAQWSCSQGNVILSSNTGNSIFVTPVAIDAASSIGDTDTITANISGISGFANVNITTSTGTNPKDPVLLNIQNQSITASNLNLLSVSPTQDVLYIETSFEYDRNGNLLMSDRCINTDHDIETFKFNEFNQLIEFNNSSGIRALYSYYADGLRKTKTIGSSSTQYFYSGSEVIAEFTKTPSNFGDITRYIHGLDPIEILNTSIQSNGTEVTTSEGYYLYNGTGDVIGIADSNGTLINNYEYDIYGKEKQTQQTINNPIRYTGQYYDAESGLYYLRARYYNPDIMRFISEDSNKGNVKDPQTLNLYAYCGGNPIKYNDPDGNYYRVYNKKTKYYSFYPSNIKLDLCYKVNGAFRFLIVPVGVTMGMHDQYKKNFESKNPGLTIEDTNYNATEVLFGIIDIGADLLNGFNSGWELLKAPLPSDVYSSYEDFADYVKTKGIYDMEMFIYDNSSIENLLVSESKDELDMKYHSTMFKLGKWIALGYIDLKTMKFKNKELEKRFHDELENAFKNLNAYVPEH